MKRGLVIGCLLVLLGVPTFSECILAKPVKVQQICGCVVSEKGGVWPVGKLRLTEARESAPTIKETFVSEKGDFVFSDIPAGKYWLYLAPGGSHYEALPTQVWLNRPSKKSGCERRIRLTLSFIPEACVSPTLVKSAEKN
jgi:hypothetical protein